MLAPHHAEDAELGKGGLAAKRLHNAVVFFRRDTVIAQQIGSDCWFVGEGGSGFHWVHNKEGSSIVA